MIDGIKLMQNENGEWAKYDDTYDVVIHCESAEEQERAINILKDRQWISVRERLPECGVPVAVLLQGQYPEDVEYEVARLTDLSDMEHPGKYWYKRGCGYLQHPKYMDGVGNLAGYEVVAWLPLPMKHEREVE
ncbi:DUF551 domain-containing protein [Fusicatenibacter sp. CLA-AA-H241]|nr:DUF551 domain-containing protein [Oliverpabstia intestinalis]